LSLVRESLGINTIENLLKTYQSCEWVKKIAVREAATIFDFHFGQEKFIFIRGNFEK